MNEPASLGAIVRERRLALGYSLGQLATKVGRTAASIRAWERGDTLPTVDEAEALAGALDLDHVQLGAMAAAQIEIDAAESAVEEDTAAVAVPENPAPEEELAATASVNADDASAQDDTSASEGADDQASSDQDSVNKDSADEGSAGGDEPEVDDAAGGDADDALHAAVVAGSAANNPWRARSIPTAGSEIEWTEGALSETELADVASSAAGASPSQVSAMADSAIHDAKTEAVPVVTPAAVAEPEVAVITAVDATAPMPARNPNPVLAAWDDAVAWYRNVFDPNKKWIYRVRYVLMAIVLYVLLKVLGWAAGELWDAIGAALDSISFSPSDTPDISS